LKSAFSTEPALLRGLHAKAYISESGWNTIISVGSGNATRPALLTGRNVEVFATLTGKRSKVGGVDEILGPRGFGRLTRPFVPGELTAPDPEDRAADARVEDARQALVKAGLRARCARVPAEEGGAALWQVSLIPSGRLSLDGIGALRVWPITRGEDHGRDALDALREGAEVDLGAMPLIDLTRFFAFRMTDATGRASALFTIGLPVDGLPVERQTAILRWIVDSREAFFRYLRLLLSELNDPFGAAIAAQSGNGACASWGKRVDDTPLLEGMVRAFCQDRERLHAVERLVTRLESSEGEGSDPVPDDFRLLWEAFRAALKEGGSANAR
jgi:hypothetical protein